MSVSSIIGGGIRLIRTQPQAVAIWAVFYAAGITLFSIVSRALTPSLAVAQSQTAASPTVIVAPPAFPRAGFGYLQGPDLDICSSAN